MPKGLRHSFGVNAFQSNVPPHLVQRWLGHASLRTDHDYRERQWVREEKALWPRRMSTMPRVAARRRRS